MSGLYAEFVEKEVLSLVEKKYNVKLTKDPDGRATTDCNSGGAAAMAMAWYHTDLYHRVLSYSGTFVYQQWSFSPETPHGAWEFHETLILKQSEEAAAHLDACQRSRHSHHPRQLSRLGPRQ
jgi:enterochelin esterase-like enzyme